MKRWPMLILAAALVALAGSLAALRIKPPGAPVAQPPTGLASAGLVTDQSTVFVLQDELSNLPPSVTYDAAIPIADVASLFQADGAPKLRALIVSDQLISRAAAPPEGAPGSAEYVALYSVLAHGHLLFGFHSTLDRMTMQLGLFSRITPWDPAGRTFPRSPRSPSATEALASGGEGMLFVFHDEPVRTGWKTLTVGGEAKPAAAAATPDATEDPAILVPRPASTDFSVTTNVREFLESMERLRSEGLGSIRGFQSVMSRAFRRDITTGLLHPVGEGGLVGCQIPPEAEVIRDDTSPYDRLLTVNRYGGEIPLCCPAGRATYRTLIWTKRDPVCVTEPSQWVVCQLIDTKGTSRPILNAQTPCVAEVTRNIHYLNFSPQLDCSRQAPSISGGGTPPPSKTWFAWQHIESWFSGVAPKTCIIAHAPNFSSEGTTGSGSRDGPDYKEIQLNLWFLNFTFGYNFAKGITVYNEKDYSCSPPLLYANYVKWQYKSLDVLDRTFFGRLPEDYICGNGWRRPADEGGMSEDLGPIKHDAAGSHDQLHANVSIWNDPSKRHTLDLFELRELHYTMVRNLDPQGPLDQRDFSRCEYDTRRWIEFGSVRSCRPLPPPGPIYPPDQQPAPTACLNCPCPHCETLTPTATRTATSTPNATHTATGTPTQISTVTPAAMTTQTPTPSPTQPLPAATPTEP